MNDKKEKYLRYTLGSVLLFVAINAFGGGLYGMHGAEDVPESWLDGTVFHSYFIPGLILFTIVGGSCLLTSIMVFRKHRFAQKAVFICALVILFWIFVQLKVIGFVSWLQPFIAGLGVLILLLNLAYKYER
ncbi:MAG: hypothetical protein U0T68_03875 [Ferruginibacter sp.]